MFEEFEFGGGDRVLLVLTFSETNLRIRSISIFLFSIGKRSWEMGSTFMAMSG
jgi:hypothetical protein